MSELWIQCFGCCVADRPPARRRINRDMIGNPTNFRHTGHVGASDMSSQGGERVGWEYHTVALSRVPVYGFGIAVSGGRDNPHFISGDPSIAISDVLKAGPAEGKLMVNDRVISVNGVSLENVDYNQAISVLRECGSAVNLLIKRRSLVTQQSNGAATAEANNNPIKVTLTKANKKDDFGIVLGCKIYVKEITNRSAVNEKDLSLQEGDIIHKINSTSTEGITLKEARKLLESCKEKVSLVVGRESTNNPFANFISNRFLNENGNYINGHSRNNAVPQNGLFNNSNSHQRWPSSVGSEQNAAPNGSTMVNGHSKENSFSGFNESNSNNNHSHNISTTSNGAPVAASIAAMANGRVNGSNTWSNQNLYVQPPTRAEYQQMNNSQTNHPLSSSALNDSGEVNSENHQQPLNSSTSRMRAPLADVSLSQLDQPATPVLSSTATTSKQNSLSATEGVPALTPVRPLPQRPSLPPNTTSTPAEPNSASLVNKKDIAPQQQQQQVATELDEQAGKPLSTAVRYISFHKEGSVGIRLTGGNEVGIFVTAVQPSSPASLQGLQVGDKILKANGTDMNTFTREEAVLYLLRIQDKIELIVQNCKSEYESIVSGQKGDSFYIRVHFNYDSDGKGELSFHVGDIFHVVDTLHNGVVGSWLVYRLGRNYQEIQKGSIPNKSRADELATEQRAEGRSKKSLSGADLGSAEGGASSRRGNFFKRRRSARRSKSLSKDHWEDVIFGDGSSKFGAYERVTLKNTGFTRPVVFFGPLADIAREKFLRDSPEKYACPRALSVNDDEETASKRSSSSKVATSGIVRLSSIKEVITSGKHALLDITPSAVDRLNYAQFYPIVIFMRAENKSIVKELRSRSSSKSTVHRSSRKLFEQSLKLEKLWHHIFTASINLTSGGDMWYKNLHETIEKEQTNTIWMAESKPEESISDDFLFPMISRLSYASSPESDLDVSANDCSRLDEDDDDDRAGKDFLGRASSPGSGRLVKASSDPSLARPLEQSSSTVVAGAVESTDSTASTTPKSSGSAKKESASKGANDSPSQRSPSKQLPLHILLRKELSKALNYDSKEKDSKESGGDESSGSPSKGNTSESELKQRRLSARQLDEIGNYPTLRASEKYPAEPVYAQSKKMQYHDQPPPPPSTLPPGVSPNSSKVKQQYTVESGPPRIDRNSKPSRFRSAHERLFGAKSIFASMVSSSSENANANNSSNNNNNNNSSNYQNDDSDYINTAPAPAKYEEPSSELPPPPPPQSPPPQTQQQPQQQLKQSSAAATGSSSSAQQRFVTGAFGDTSSYSSDSYNKYGSGSSTLEQVNHQHGTRTGQNSMPPVGGPNGEPYKPPRRSAPQLSALSSKQSSLERSKPLPPPPFLLNGASKVEPPIPLSSTFGNKAPPSPPPKPASKLGMSSSSSSTLQYQMNSLSLNDSRPPPPPKPLSMPPPPMPNSLYDKQVQSDYDNMPVIMANVQRPGYPGGPLDPNNGPPGYYQSLPQSSYAFHSKHDGQPRYSSTAETISNFINGPSNNGFSNAEPTYNSFSSLRRPPSGYLDMNGDPALGKPPPPPAAPEMSPSKLNTYSSSSNYEHMRYPSITSSVYPNSSSSLGYSTTSQQHQQQSMHPNGPYLNVPYPSKSPYSHEVNLNSYSMGSNSSPLPPPPPLPPSFHGQGGHIGNHGLVHPTPQQAHQSGQSYHLDLSLNREHRGSAFEVYRKPEQSLHSESPLFHGLPPPPPPLTANDYNQPNYCNLDELTNSPMYLNTGGNNGGSGGDISGNTDEAVVIAFAKGVFDCEGGTLVSPESGVSLFIPPDAIPPGLAQEIYFKVCRDHSLAPPLDKSKGETLLSPIVMCGPRGLHFNVPIELRLPHCIDVDASWSVALKSKNASAGEASGWRSISINDDEGISNNDFNDFNQQSVTVLIDHF